MEKSPNSIKPNKVLILFTRIIDPQTTDLYNKYYSQLPKSVTARIDAYLRMQDKILSILGIQLLLCGLQKLGFDKEHIEALKHNKNNRPYLEKLPQLDFNISHSESLTVCALSMDVHIGIDIEKEKPVDIHHFKDQFSSAQWEEMETSQEPEKLFFDYWAQKEAVFKGSNSDSTTPFSEIDIHPNRAIIHNNTWYLTRLDIDPSYCAWLASDELADPIIEEVHF